MNAKLQKIINDYKNNLQKFITENHLSTDILNDIDERIFEKISEISNPTHQDIANILAEIGTPEEIFADEISEKSSLKEVEKSTNFFQKFQKRTEGIIFL